jgi:ABC-2 type transport system permease protein
VSTVADAAAPSGPVATGGSSTRRVMAVVRRHALVQSRNPGHWFLLIALPVVDALLFTSIGVAYGEGDRAVQILLTGILLFHVVWQLTLAGSMGFLEEVWSRNVLNMLTTPLTEREYGAALGVVGMARTVVAAGLVALVGIGLYTVDPAASGWVLIPGAIILLVFGWAVSLFVIGMTLQYGESAEVFSWGTLVLLMPLSGVFYPVEALPGVLQPIARVIPLSRVFDAARDGLSGRPIDPWDLIIGGLGSLVAVAAAGWFVMFQLRRFREQGWVTRFS